MQRYGSAASRRWCEACRSTILRAFAFPSGLQSRPSLLVEHPSWGRPVRRLSQARRLAAEQVSEVANVRVRVEEEDEEEVDAAGGEEQGVGEDGRDRATSDSVEKQMLPWYLQVPSQRDEPQPSLPRQQLPELPEYPPPLLEPLLKHVSIELGLDDLTLLDLRTLDPPPALGANTLMVIGTARSEKHLHVSADRLCRWLRSNYKLRPYADGLLGRNELKLKLRRKTRKAKLLGSSTGAAASVADDEFRTGWVCVNVGEVKPSERVKSPPERTEGIVGFGSYNDGVRIVVQMFTEEKRLDLDLEGLWGGLLDKHSQKARDREPQNSEDDRTVGTKAYVPVGVRSYSTSPVVSGPLIQKRRMHTSVSRPDAYVRPRGPDREAAIPRKTEISRPERRRHSVRRPTFVHKAAAGLRSRTHVWNRSTGSDDTQLGRRVIKGLEHLIEAGDYKIVRQKLLELSEEPGVPSKRVLLLRTLINQLRQAPLDVRRQMLGKGPDDFTSTRFLHAFYQTFPPFADAEHWDSRVRLYCYALEAKHPAYTKDSLRTLFDMSQRSGVVLREPTLNLILQAALANYDANWRSKTGIPYFEFVLTIVDHMYTRNLPVLGEDLFVRLHEAVSFKEPVRLRHEPRKSRPLLPRAHKVWERDLRKVQKRQARLNLVAQHLNIPFTSESNILRLLTLLANQGDWHAFWEAWRLPAVHALPRSAAMYTYLFHTMARTKHQAFCIQTLRQCIPEMDLETPRVTLTDSCAGAVMHCLRHAHPPVEEEAQRVPIVHGEWVKLWRRCLAGGGASG